MQQVNISDLTLEEILYFSDESIENYKRDELFKKPSIALLMKRSSENLPNAIDDVVAQMVYGNSRRPPGDENSPYQKLLQRNEDVEISGIWAPSDSLCKAMALKWFFPNISGPFKLPEEKSILPHLLIGYDAFKYREVMELSKQFPEAVMKYGFFSSEVPGEAELITKTVDQFEQKTTPPTYEEKIVIQLAKKDEWFADFCELGPSYMSPDTVKGREDSKFFFPATYDIPIIAEIKKKSKKKAKGKFVAVVEEAQGEQIQKADKATESVTENEEQTAELTTDRTQSTEDKANEGEGEEGEEEEEEGEEDDEERVEEIDKATSPMGEDKAE